MRKLLIGAGLASLALGACSKQADMPPGGPHDNAPPATRFETSSADVSEGRAAPSISPSAAPGVAFDYKYAFQLPDDAIAAVQEAHASRCEALGLARCRITGLTYSVGDENEVSATLVLKLASDIARGYGKEATGAVVKAGGHLSQTEFTGEDTSLATSDATVQQTDAQARIDEINKRLVNPAAGNAEKLQLQGELAGLRAQIGQAKSTISTQTARLAATPMSFSYYGKGGITGFNGRNPLTEAGQSFTASLVTMISVVLTLLATLLPWLALLALILILIRTRIVRAAWRRLGPARRDDGDGANPGFP